MARGTRPLFASCASSSVPGRLQPPNYQGLPYKAVIQGSKCIHDLNYSIGLGELRLGDACIQDQFFFLKLRKKN